MYGESSLHLYSATLPYLCMSDRTCLVNSHRNDFLAFLCEILLYFIGVRSIGSSEKFLSLYKEIMDAQHFSFYIILSNYI